jgi:hypothetical protein
MENVYEAMCRTEQDREVTGSILDEVHLRMERSTA